MPPGRVISCGLPGLNFGSENVVMLSGGFMPLLPAHGCLEILSAFLSVVIGAKE